MPRLSTLNSSSHSTKLFCTEVPPPLPPRLPATLLTADSSFASASLPSVPSRTPSLTPRKQQGQLERNASVEQERQEDCSTPLTSRQGAGAICYFCEEKWRNIHKIEMNFMSTFIGRSWTQDKHQHQRSSLKKEINGKDWHSWRNPGRRHWGMVTDLQRWLNLRNDAFQWLPYLPKTKRLRAFFKELL